MLLLWLALALLIVVGLTWIVVLLLQAPLLIAFIVTGVAVFAFLTVLIVRRIRASMRAAALERELLKAAAQQAANARPDRRAEVLALQAQMKAAITALKKTKLGKKGGQAALYALPWYSIVGPPAAGKTTALMQSNLGFITPPGGSSGKVRGTAGTRNCDWWFSEQAILLDTAGRLATGEDDRDEWHGFLEMLKKFRPGRPLDGVVVAISVEDILGKSELELEELAKTLRTRADEIMERLEMVLPVYVLVTKVDLVAGFIEFWGDLSKSHRGQTWGASFELSEDLADLQHAVESEFDLLLKVLYARMLQRLSTEPLQEVRARILQFPVEFTALRAPLAKFVEELCRSNPYQETPILRGFYFSSGTQTGRAIDRVLENMARGFNVPLMQTSGQRAQQGPPQSYFVTELFQRVIFPDRHLGVRTQGRERRRFRTQAIQASIVALLVLALVIPAAAAYVENAKLIRATATDVSGSLQLERAPGAGVAATAGALDMLVGRVDALEKAAEQTRVRGYIGPYTAPDMQDAIKRVYLDRLRGLVHGPVHQQMLSDVRAIGDLVRMDAANFQQAYEDLKLYLMLVRTQHLDVEWATPALARSWARALRSEVETDQEKLLTHSRYYLSELSNNKAWALPGDEVAIARAQGRLGSLPLEELRYSWLVEAAKGAPAIRSDKVSIGAAQQYFVPRNESVAVPGLYTAFGWGKVRHLIESPDSRLDLDDWVIGQKLGVTAQGGAERLRELYFQRYVKAWTDFIGGFEVVVPKGDVKVAIDELRVLQVNDGPYVRLFKILAENTRLNVTPPKTLLDKLEDKGAKLINKAAKDITDAGVVDAGPTEREISVVERTFEPLLKFGFGEQSSGRMDAAPSGLTQYLGQLTTLEVALSQLAENPMATTQDFDMEVARTSITVQRLLGGMEPRTRMVLQPLLMNPIRGTRAIKQQADATAMSDAWKEMVWNVYQEKIAPRYPFSDVPAEMAVSDFVEFFRPEGGLIWKYYAENVQGRLDRSGNRFSNKSTVGMTQFRPDFLACLSVAAEITDAVFGTQQVPLVPFSIQMHPASSNISEISLILDGKPTVYRNEPERWIQVEWPGKGQPHGATLQVRGAQFQDEIPRLGDFGLFRLLEAGSVKATNQLSEGLPVLAGSWPLTRAGEPPINIDIRPQKSVHPFSRGFFKRLRCPPVTTMAVVSPG